MKRFFRLGSVLAPSWLRVRSVFAPLRPGGPPARPQHEIIFSYTSRQKTLRGGLEPYLDMDSQPICIEIISLRSNLRVYEKIYPLPPGIDVSLCTETSIELDLCEKSPQGGLPPAICTYKMSRLAKAYNRLSRTLKTQKVVGAKLGTDSEGPRLSIRLSGNPTYLVYCLELADRPSKTDPAAVLAAFTQFLDQHPQVGEALGEMDAACLKNPEDYALEYKMTHTATRLVSTSFTTE